MEDNKKKMNTMPDMPAMVMGFGKEMEGVSVGCQMVPYRDEVYRFSMCLHNQTGGELILEEVYCDISMNKPPGQHEHLITGAEDYFFVIPDEAGMPRLTIMPHNFTQAEAVAWPDEQTCRCYFYISDAVRQHLPAAAVWKNEGRILCLGADESISLDFLVKDCRNEIEISEFLFQYDQIPYTIQSGVNGMRFSGHHFDDTYMALNVYRQVASSYYMATFKNGRLSSLQATGGSVETIDQQNSFGDVVVGLADGTVIDTAAQQFSSQDCCFMCEEGGLRVKIGFAAESDELGYCITLENTSGQEMDITELKIPVHLNSQFGWKVNASERLIRHSQIAGDNSFFLGVPCDGQGPYLLCVPEAGTGLELFDLAEDGAQNRVYYMYIHGQAAAAAAREQAGGRWRLPVTSGRLTAGCSVTYRFRFCFVRDYEAAREALVAHGKVDIKAVPGLTVPKGQKARIRLKGNYEQLELLAEHPEKTEIRLVKRENNVWIYDVAFSGIGEQLLTIKYGDHQVGYLEMFSTLPVKDLLTARGNYLKNSQIRDAGLWYDGLIQERNSKTGQWLNPDNYDELPYSRRYAAAADDPGLSKPAFLAAKNAELPDQEEIEALDYYIEKFVWGGLQRTDQDEYPYGIYGVPDWHELRRYKNYSPNELLHLWRMYDYPHIALMYVKMYEIGVSYPQIRLKLDKREYLLRAYGTFLAMYQYANEMTHTYPWNKGFWSPYNTGFFNELVIVQVIDALRKEQLPVKAMRLEYHWQRKAAAFIGEERNLFESEAPFDTTGFETTQALVNWGREHAQTLFSDNYRSLNSYTVAEVERFEVRQRDCNLACRGTIENAYYITGSDIRGDSTKYTLGYMAQMGGWALLEDALYSAEEPFELLRIAYTSLLSSLCLINAGEAEENYGYWFPGSENHGASSGGFEAAPAGKCWMGPDQHHGVWVYGSETDLGYCGYLRGASMIYAVDPLFGEICYGGLRQKTQNGLRLQPTDGVGRQFHFIQSRDERLHVILSHQQIESIELGPENEMVIHFKASESKAAMMRIFTHGGKGEIEAAGVSGTKLMIETAGKNRIMIRWRKAYGTH